MAVEAAMTAKYGGRRELNGLDLVVSLAAIAVETSDWLEASNWEEATDWI